MKIRTGRDGDEFVLGMLWGLHTGDALGAPWEFFDGQIPDDHTFEITGGGELKWTAGEATDDTLMMLMVLESVVTFGKVDIQDLRARFISWYRSKPKDIGGTVRQAIHRMITSPVHLPWGLSTEYSQGNGSLMRCAPLALIDPGVSDIAAQCAMTHAHPNCIEADKILIKCLRLALQGVPKVEIVESAIAASSGNSALYKCLNHHIEQGSNDRCDGYVLDTLGVALWGFLHFDSFEKSLIAVIKRSTDADTVGAVTGALCGAFYGAYAIPERWLEKLMEKDKIERLVAAWVLRGA